MTPRLVSSQVPAGTLLVWSVMEIWRGLDILCAHAWLCRFHWQLYTGSIRSRFTSALLFLLHSTMRQTDRLVACGGNSGVKRETGLRMMSSVMHVFNNGLWQQKPSIQGSDEHLAVVWETVTERYSIIYTWHQWIVGINSVKCLMEIRRQGEPKGLHYPDWMKQTVITDWLIVDTISFGRNNF
jgi:hypothetical protein